jgi:GMP synthase (glutamine-hydrolysing)
MRLLAIVHEATAGPGVFAQAAAAAGAQLDYWRPPDRPEPPPYAHHYDAVMTLGGAVHPDQDDGHPWLRREKQLLAELIDSGTPLLGVCLGAELIAGVAGATVGRAREPEIGWYPVEPTAQAAGDPLLGGLPASFDALEWHSYAFELPAGATPLASSPGCLQAYRLGDAVWGIQFHAEVTLGDFESWLDDLHSDPDAVALGLEPDHLRLVTRHRIDAWNELGRELCTRFVGFAADR